MIEEMLDLKPRLSDFERSKLATAERLRVREAKATRADYSTGDKRKRSIWERIGGQHLEYVPPKIVRWTGLNTLARPVPSNGAACSHMRTFPAHKPNHKNTGSLRTLRVAEFVNELDPPTSKARKSNTEQKWLLRSPDSDKFASGFDRMQYHNHGPSRPRFEATRAASKQRRGLLEEDRIYLQFAPQRPLLNARKAASSMFNVIRPASGGDDEAKFKLLRYPSLASRIKPKGLSRIGRSTRGLDVRRAPMENLLGYRDHLRSLSYPEQDIMRATDTSRPLNSVVSVPDCTEASDFVSEYDCEENLNTKHLGTRTNMAASSARIPLRESVLIAQELRRSSPTRHGEKASLYLDQEFFADTSPVGLLSSGSWYRSLKERKEARKWRAARHENIRNLKQNVADCEQAMQQVRDDIQNHLNGKDDKIENAGLSDEAYIEEQNAILDVLMEDIQESNEEILKSEALMELNEAPLENWPRLRDSVETRKRTGKMLATETKKSRPKTVVWMGRELQVGPKGITQLAS